MGVKSKVRSMQRGAHQHDRGPQDTTPDYANFAPIMSRSEGLHFGSEGAQRDEFLGRLDNVVRSLVKAGFGKPTDISRLLNRQHVRTFVGDQWSPRLCSFLKKELAVYRKRETARADLRRAAEQRYRADLKKRSKAPNPTNLTDTELRRRQLALLAHNARSCG